MKKLLLAVTATAFLFSAGFTYNQEKDYSQCRAQRISGKLIFMNAEPVQEYEVVFQVKAFYMGSPETPLELAEHVVKKALNERRDFDAIIMNAGKHHVAVKFKKS